MHYLFESPTEVIDVNQLVKELQSLNTIILQFVSKTNLGKGITKTNKSKKVCQNKTRNKRNKTRNKRNY